MNLNNRITSLNNLLTADFNLLEATAFLSVSANFGRAERGDSTAEDGRKQERSSAPYAVAYLPHGSENILGNTWDISGSNENRPLIIRLGDFRPMPAHEH